MFGVAVCYLLAIDEELKSVTEVWIILLGFGKGAHEGGMPVDVGWIEAEGFNVLLYQFVKQL